MTLALYKLPWSTFFIMQLLNDLKLTACIQCKYTVLVSYLIMRWNYTKYVFKRLEKSYPKAFT